MMALFVLRPHHQRESFQGGAWHCHLHIPQCRAVFRYITIWSLSFGPAAAPTLPSSELQRGQDTDSQELASSEDCGGQSLQ